MNCNYRDLDTLQQLFLWTKRWKPRRCKLLEVPLHRPSDRLSLTLRTTLAFWDMIWTSSGSPSAFFVPSRSAQGNGSEAYMRTMRAARTPTCTWNACPTSRQNPCRLQFLSLKRLLAASSHPCERWSTPRLHFYVPKVDCFGWFVFGCPTIVSSRLVLLLSGDGHIFEHIF